jgi:hypothetical protein
LEPADFPEKIAEISDIGWDNHNVMDASCVRMPSDMIKRVAIENANAKLADASDGVLPPVVPGTAIVSATRCPPTMFVFGVCLGMVSAIDFFTQDCKRRARWRGRTVESFLPKRDPLHDSLDGIA